MFGFSGTFLSMDGEQSNRDFKHLLLDGSAFWIRLLKKSVHGSIFGELGKDL
jgi:hypothetical protein